MNQEDRASSGLSLEKEAPTQEAVLCITLVPEGTGNEQFKPTAGFRQRFTENCGGISNARRRIHAALEAETAAVPEVAAEIIDRELSYITSARLAVHNPSARRLTRPISRARRSPLMLVPRDYSAGAPGRPSSDDQEPTAAAELRIALSPRLSAATRYGVPDPDAKIQRI